MRRWSYILPALTACLLAGQALGAGLYKVDPGPHAVQAVPMLILYDAKRDKELQLRVTFPRDGGPCPTIVWSHGAMGTKDAYQPLVQHWVSHGYVVIQANHSDSLALGDSDGRNIFLDWASRPQDVSFILDSLDEIRKKAPAWKDKMDAARIGVGGHSFGAHTSQLLAGATTRRPLGRRASHADDRPKAFLLVSPQGTGQILDKESWKPVTRPMMVITGTNDLSGRTGEGAAWRKAPFELSPPGDKYLVFIEGAYHGFGGIAGKVRYPSSGPENPDHVAYVRSAGLAFWDAYLREDKTALEYLNSKDMEKAAEGKLTLTTRPKPTATAPAKQGP